MDLEQERRIFDFQPVWTEGDCWEFNLQVKFNAILTIFMIQMPRRGTEKKERRNAVK